MGNVLLPPWAALLLLVLACGSLGWLLLGIFGPARLPQKGDDRRFIITLELAFAALALGVTLLGWIAFVLGELGVYSLLTLAVIWLVLLLLLLFFRFRRPAAAPVEPGAAPSSSRLILSPRWEPFFLLLWFVAALWLFFRPHEFIIGGADAGVYVNLAAEIAQNGRVLIDDSTFNQLDPALYPALLRANPVNPIADYYLFPAFYVASQEGPTIMPQFYHLHPVWQAAAYGLGGVWAALLLTGLWTLLGSLAVYLTVRQFAGWEAAALALAGLSLNGVQQWFARYPTTEPLTQYLLWTGLWSLALWLSGRGPRPLWALLAGLTLGELFLVRIDFYFIWLIVGLLFLWQLGSGELRRDAAWFYTPLALLTAHSFLHGLTQSRPYFYEIFGYGLRLLARYWLLPVTAVLVALVILFIFVRYRGRLAQLGRYRRHVLLVGVVLVLLLGVYGWFIRPGTGAASAWNDWYSTGQIPRPDHENLLRLGWYLSPLGVWLGILGTCLLIWRADRRNAVMIGVGLLFSLLYLWRIQTNPHHIYTMRRYVPVTLPFFIVAAAALIVWLAVWRKPLSLVLGGLLALAWLGGLGWLARGFVTQVDYAGLIDQVAALSEQIGPDAVLIFNDPAPVGQGDFIGTPLEYLYGEHVFTVRDPAALDTAVLAAQIDRWQAAGHDVYWLAVPDGYEWPLPQRPLQAPAAYAIHTAALEGRYDRRPTEIIPTTWQGTIWRVAP
ncbi:MAG: hypothetical protein H6659_09600 [Ardenticatenaceae bacterium]|nr:hypothetical protein [Ardenticatenaceae bacterium]